MYDMINIFEVFLPQLLAYPNPTDPLNGEAAALMMREPRSYEAKVRGALQSYPVKNSTGMLTMAEFVAKYATKDAADEAGEDEESEDEMSSVGSCPEDDEEDDEVAGNMEEL